MSRKNPWDIRDQHHLMSKNPNYRKKIKIIKALWGHYLFAVFPSLNQSLQLHHEVIYGVTSLVQQALTLTLICSRNQNLSRGYRVLWKYMTYKLPAWFCLFLFISHIRRLAQLCYPHQNTGKFSGNIEYDETSSYAQFWTAFK